MNTLEKFRRETEWNPFDRFLVKIRLHDLVGGTPKNPDLIEGWINATNKEKSDEERERLRDATLEELEEVTDEKADKTAIGFKRDKQGLYIEGRCVKAMLKEAANIIKNIAPGKKKGKKVVGIVALKSKVADQCFVEDRRIPIDRGEPDAVEERPIHVMTAQGERTALKRVEICRDVSVSFTVRLRRNSEVTWETLCAILDYNQTLGLGADRSQGRGQFELLSVEKL